MLEWSSGEKRDLAAEGAKVVELLKNKLGHHIIESSQQTGDAVAFIRRDGALDFFKILKLDAELTFNFLVDITVVDWLDSKPERFEVVYHLLSLAHGYRLCVKIAVPEEDPEVESLVSLWNGANFMEREAWDMYGVKFRGHPDLRRVLMYDEFQGHPLRKDYPLQKKQPRVRLRSPEVSNTARDMHRENLVSISPRRRSEA